MHIDAIQPGQKCLVVDDLLATGGTAKAMAQLVEKLGGEVVDMLFMIELAGLEGRKFLEGYRVDSASSTESKNTVFGSFIQIVMKARGCQLAVPFFCV